MKPCGGMSFRQSIVTPPLVHSLAHVPRTWSRMRFYPEQKNVRLRANSDEEDALIRSRYLPEEPTGCQSGCLCTRSSFSK